MIELVYEPTEAEASFNELLTRVRKAQVHSDECISNNKKFKEALKEREHGKTVVDFRNR